MFGRDVVVEILNLGPRGDKVKAYQVKQLRGVIVAYRLAGAPEAPPPVAEESPTTDTGEAIPEGENE